MDSSDIITDDMPEAPKPPSRLTVEVMCALARGQQFFDEKRAALTTVTAILETFARHGRVYGPQNVAARIAETGDVDATDVKAKSQESK